MTPVQLDLFTPEPAPSGPATAPAVAGGPFTPPVTAGRRDGRLRHDSGAIPPRCPVLDRAVCYRQDCRHWSAGACCHPARNAKRTRVRSKR